MSCVTAAEQIGRLIPQVKSGTLRFWGDWFGRPMDNFHSLVNCGATDDRMVFAFDQSECLTVWQPVGISISADSFKISDADRVRWVWFYYGRPHTSENRYFLDYVRVETQITVSTNVDWYAVQSQVDRASPAVEMY